VSKYSSETAEMNFKGEISHYPLQQCMVHVLNLVITGYEERGSNKLVLQILKG
jgi:hypothetical protein